MEWVSTWLPIAEKTFMGFFCFKFVHSSGFMISLSLHDLLKSIRREWRQRKGVPRMGEPVGNDSSGPSNQGQNTFTLKDKSFLQNN